MPRSPPPRRREFAIVEMLRKRWSHVSAERVLSGAGLVNLYEALCEIGGIEPLMLSPADVTRHAMNKTDKAASAPLPCSAASSAASPAISR